MEMQKGKRGSLCWKFVHMVFICSAAAAAVLCTIFPWKWEGVVL